MAGNKSGGLKIRETLIAKLGSEEAYKQHVIERGRKGGQAKVPKGFAVNRELARVAGQKGGLTKSSNRREQ